MPILEASEHPTSELDSRQRSASFNVKALTQDLQAIRAELLARFNQYLGLGLYSEAVTPREEVAEWLLDPELLDWALDSERRGALPCFIGLDRPTFVEIAMAERGIMDPSGVFVMAECSPEVPPSPRDLCYGPRAAAWEFGDEYTDHNALTQAKVRGGSLITPTHIQALIRAGLVENKHTWHWVYSGKDSLELPRRVAGSFEGFSQRELLPTIHSDSGGMRCMYMAVRPSACVR